MTTAGTRRVSLAALVCTKPGSRPWLIYRTHIDRGPRRERRKGFTIRHLSLQQPDPRDIAPDRSRGEGGGQGGEYDCAGAPYAGGRGAEFPLSVEPDVGEPDVVGQVLAAALAHHRDQAQSVLGGRGRHGTAFTHVAVEALALGVAGSCWAGPVKG
ncbi:hypothetical protein ACFC8N_43840 [Streptomyces sp. NPDC055966]|uniref:hypothetical protein n=1 Tax=Streptomyces sp. NPDC055966 TaxID=3345669 RepID=UPI0035D791DC